MTEPEEKTEGTATPTALTPAEPVTPICAEPAAETAEADAPVSAAPAAAPDIAPAESVPEEPVPAAAETTAAETIPAEPAPTEAVPAETAAPADGVLPAEEPVPAEEASAETESKAEKAAESVPAKPAAAPAETKPAEAAEEKGKHPLQKIKSAEFSCVEVKGKLVATSDKQYLFVFGQKATVTVKGYSVHIYAHAGLLDSGKVEVLPTFLHVGEGDAPWGFIIKHLAVFGKFGGFIVQDYSDEIRKGLAQVSLSTRHYSSVSSPAATTPALSRAHYDFTTAFKRVWQNTGGRVDDCEKLELLASMCVDSLADFFKSKVYPIA